jgi:hypothetical protein
VNDASSCLTACTANAACGFWCTWALTWPAPSRPSAPPDRYSCRHWRAALSTKRNRAGMRTFQFNPRTHIT